MADTINFLLINGALDQYWAKVLREALGPYGPLSVKLEADSIEPIISGQYQLVIVDEAATDNVSLLVARIRAQRPEIGIVVATASPAWDKAREAFQSGATDYIRKTFDRSETASAIRAALLKIQRPKH